jgi:digeranylgeranylglycerophospholipid reductase
MRAVRRRGKIVEKNRGKVIMENGGRFDIIIAGGGPAGLVAALHATKDPRRRLRVCLIDRKKEPGAPVRCGEAIGLKGFAESVHLDAAWIKSTIVKAKLVSPSGISVTLPGNHQSYIIDRRRMEEDLTADAVKNGVTFIPNATVVSAEWTVDGDYSCATDSGTRYRAYCLILADGVESRLARGLGWKTALKRSDVITCAFAKIEHPSIEPDACLFFLGKSIAPGGYAWVFSRGEYQANIGLGVLGSMNSAGKPKKLLDEFIGAGYPGARIFDTHCGAVPMARWLTPLVKCGAMVVGDAARQVNCTTGAGLAYAFYSGMTAGTAAARACDGNSCDHRILKQYEKQWASHYGKQQRRSHALKEVMVGFSDSFLDEIARSLSMVEPSAMNASRVFLKAFSKHPLLALKVIKLFR